MGGHSAWRKRVERGELAKQSGGAICRHRPHFGRKGKDLIKNRKGNIGINGNPKKRKGKQHGEEINMLLVKQNRASFGSVWAVILLVAFLAAAFLFSRSS